MGELENKSPKKNAIIWLVVIVSISCAAWFVIPHFIPPKHDDRSYQTCLNNLRELDAMKNEWAFEHHATNGEIIPMDQFTNYFRSGEIPKCPSGGTYTIGKIGEPPTCSLGTTVNPPHVLP